MSKQTPHFLYQNDSQSLFQMLIHSFISYCCYLSSFKTSFTKSQRVSWTLSFYIYYWAKLPADKKEITIRDRDRKLRNKWEFLRLLCKSPFWSLYQLPSELYYPTSGSFTRHLPIPLAVKYLENQSANPLGHRVTLSICVLLTILAACLVGTFRYSSTFWKK